MAKRLNLLNFTYTAVGIAAAAGISYYVWRRLRARGEAAATEGMQGTQDNLMDIRRSTRKAGRAVKDTATQVGKTVKRGAQDVGEAFADANSSGKAMVEQESSGYKSTY